MGRGRAKAKQTKVARALKYYSPNTDLSALERELHTQRHERPRAEYDRWDEDDDYEQWAAGGH